MFLFDNQPYVFLRADFIFLVYKIYKSKKNLILSKKMYFYYY